MHTFKPGRPGNRILALVPVLILILLGVGPGSAQSQTPSKQYRIGPEDEIQVQVWQRPDLSGTFPVNESGEVNVPLIGVVKAEGLTAQELGAQLERQFVILDPGITQILVTVTGFNSLRYTVVGEVRQSGTYTFREIPNLWEAIFMAGGETPAADMSAVQILRAEGGTSRTITVDLSRGMAKTPVEDLPALHPGDSIVVPSLEANAVSGDHVQVLGAVRSPGLYSVRVATSVVEALSVSGGYLESAKLDKVTLARRHGDGTLVYDLNLKAYLEGGHPQADMPLRAGDTITVPGGGGTATLESVLRLSAFISATASIILAVNAINN